VLCMCDAEAFSVGYTDEQVHIGHCGMCRRWSGGPLMFVRAEVVDFSGTEHLTRFKSAEWAERGFCNKCGSSLLYHLLPANQILLSLGSFDDASAFALGSEIFIDHKLSSDRKSTRLNSSHVKISYA